MGAKLTGSRELKTAIKGLGKKSISINRQAVNAASTPVLRGVKDECPVDHGDLKKAMTKKVYNRGAVAIAVIGADASYVASEATGEKLKLGSTKEETNAILAHAREDGGLIRPAKYDHLVEFGHLTPDGKQIPAHPFIRNGWSDSVDAAEKVYESKMAEGIEKAAEAK